MQATSGPSSTRSVIPASQASVVQQSHGPALAPAVPAVEQMVADPDRVEAALLRRPRHRCQLGAADDPLDLGQLDADLEPLGSRPERLERGRVGGDRDDLPPDAELVLDQEHLVDVELAAEPPPLRAVDRDGVLVVGERPAQRAQVRAFGEPPRLTEQLEDPLAGRRTPARPGRSR